MSEINIAEEDLWPLLLSTIRHAMGRRSYLPGYVQEMVQNYSSHLSDAQLKQMQQEVEDELRIQNTFPGHMGMECDVKGWEKFVVWCQKESDKRTKKPRKQKAK